MPNNKKLIKVSYIRQEHEYISELYPEYKLIKQINIQMNIEGKIIPVDVLTIQTNHGTKKFYFDVSDIFNKYDSLLTSTDDLNDIDFAKLFLKTVLGAQTKAERKNLPWLQKIQENIKTKTIETEQESEKTTYDNTQGIYTPLLLLKILMILLCVIFLFTLIFLYPHI